VEADHGEEAEGDTEGQPGQKEESLGPYQQGQGEAQHGQEDCPQGQGQKARGQSQGQGQSAAEARGRSARSARPATRCSAGAATATHRGYGPDRAAPIAVPVAPAIVGTHAGSWTRRGPLAERHIATGWRGLATLGGGGFRRDRVRGNLGFA